METWRQHLPPPIAAVIGSETGQSVHEGQSGAIVLRLPDELYLKITPVDHPQAVKVEAERLSWLTDHLRVPQVVAYAENEQYQYLLTTAISGQHPLHDDLKWTPAQRVTALAAVARRIHALPVTDCPFSVTLDTRLQRAQARITDQPTERTRFADLVAGRTAQAVYDELLTLRPASDDRVVTHGDLYPINIRFNPETRAFNGVFDVGDAGIADRYRDLAPIVNALHWHLGAEWVSRFFTLYGHAPDHDKLRFYRLLSAFL